MSGQGYHGKVLHVDLSERRCLIEEPGELFRRRLQGVVKDGHAEPV